MIDLFCLVEHEQDVSQTNVPSHLPPGMHSKNSPLPPPPHPHPQRPTPKKNHKCQVTYLQTDHFQVVSVHPDVAEETAAPASVLPSGFHSEKKGANYLIFNV